MIRRDVRDLTEDGLGTLPVGIVLHVVGVLDYGHARNRGWALWWLDPSVRLHTYPGSGVGLPVRGALGICSQLLTLELGLLEALVIPKDI